jgi:hypothetical protein
MKYAKVGMCVIFALGLLVIGCSKEKAKEGPQQEYMTKNLVPSKVEVNGESVALTFENLNTSWTVDTASQEIVQTPALRGSYKIVNTSKDLLEIQGVTVEYLDQAGNTIPFQSGDKIARASLMLSSLKPGESSDGSLDATFPRTALKTLDKIRVNIVYIPSPLKREVLTITEKVE